MSKHTSGDSSSSIIAPLVSTCMTLAVGSEGAGMFGTAESQEEKANNNNKSGEPLADFLGLYRCRFHFVSYDFSIVSTPGYKCQQCRTPYDTRLYQVIPFSVLSLVTGNVFYRTYAPVYSIAVQELYLSLSFTGDPAIQDTASRFRVISV